MRADDHKEFKGPEEWTRLSWTMWNGVIYLQLLQVLRSEDLLSSKSSDEEEVIEQKQVAASVLLDDVWSFATPEKPTTPMPTPIPTPKKRQRAKKVTPDSSSSNHYPLSWSKENGQWSSDCDLSNSSQNWNWSEYHWWLLSYIDTVLFVCHFLLYHDCCSIHKTF